MGEFGASSVAVVAIVFLGALVRSTFGFGDAMVAMPLLSLVVSVQTATPLVALVSPLCAVTIMWRHRRQLRWKIVLPLIVPAAVGIPLGLFYLRHVDPGWVKLVLAVIIIGFSSYSLFRPRLLVLANDRWAWLFGLMAGALGGAYNTHGPPLALYGSLRQWSPDKFRATLQGYFLPASAMVISGHALGGLWTRQVFTYYLLCLPAVGVAVVVGRLLAPRIDGPRFARCVYVLLLAIGVLLLLAVL